MKVFLDELTDEEVAAIVAGMKEVQREGLRAGKHLRGDVYEIVADAPPRSFRLLFSSEGRFGQVLLSLSGFVKKTQKTPQRELELAGERSARSGIAAVRHGCGCIHDADAWSLRLGNELTNHVASVPEQGMTIEVPQVVAGCVRTMAGELHTRALAFRAVVAAEGTSRQASCADP